MPLLDSVTSSRPTPQLRRLTAEDVDFAHGLNATAGWNQTTADWQGYLEFEPEGCFIAELGGRRAGTATAIRYGTRFGWIGMVLVEPDLRRYGIGTLLLRQTIAFLQARGTACIKLDATPMGRNVYVPLGFVDEYELSRYEGAVPADGLAPEPGVEAFSAVEFGAIAAFDAPVFGAPREAVLHSMSRRNPAWCFVARDGAQVCGYLIARPGRLAVQLGPWLARDAATAERLLRSFFPRAGGQRVFLDVPHPNASARALVEKYGFTVQRGFTRMCLGQNHHPGQPSLVYGTSGAEKG